MRMRQINLLAGTTTNDNAAAGQIGEYLSATLAVGSATSLTTATAKTITNTYLPPGDWDVDGIVDFFPAASTSITVLARGASATTNTLGADDTYASDSMAATVPGAVAQRMVIPTQRVTIANNTTTVTITNATPAVATYAGADNFANNDVTVFATTDTLPSPLVAGTEYYIVSINTGANTFQISATVGGAAINTTTNGSGTHTFYAKKPEYLIASATFTVSTMTAFGSIFARRAR